MTEMKNTLFPGRLNYEGPTEGMFGLLHHEVLAEMSHDVMERVAYVKCRKPENEVATRLHNMIYLGGCPAAAKFATLDAAYDAKFATLDAAYMAKCDTLNAEHRAKHDALCAEILAYIKTHIPDCAWDGTTLVFPEAQ